MLAFVCVLLIGFASSAQAVHSHGEYLPGHAAHVGGPPDASQIPGGEANCPLCVAMHSALPTTTGGVTVTTALVACTVATVVGRIADEPWHFAMFSRPPPAVSTL